MATHDEARWLAEEEYLAEEKRWSENDRQIGGSHYRDMKIQPWDVIDAFSYEEFVGYHRGVVISYVMRAGQKGDIAEDFEKAAHHLMKAAEQIRARRAEDGATGTD